MFSDITLPCRDLITINMRFNVLATAVLATTATAQVTAWGQCGGGSVKLTSCVSGYKCSIINDFYHQCVPGTPTEEPLPEEPIITPSPTLPGSNTGGTGTAPPKTLMSGYYWIRAVVAPNYRSYLQAAPTSTPYPGPGDAYILNANRAGQFQVTSGQLVYNTGSSIMYMNVENPTDKKQRMLRTWFAAEKNSYGTFAWSGDTLTWSVADIKRENVGAWLVCGSEKKLVINTGAYGYMTPSGCTDHTIHYYNAKQADT